MDPNTFPTKGNLILAQNTLKLSNQGYELMDKKRNVLIREILDLNEKALKLQSEIENTFKEAYLALQHANIEMGITKVERFSRGVPVEENIRIRSRSIMGVDIPVVSCENDTQSSPFFGFGDTSTALDNAVREFNDVKALIMQLAMVENAAYRLAVNIRKTQKRANALKNVTIPKYKALVKQIQQTLEERERDEFTRLKVIKKKA